MGFYYFTVLLSIMSKSYTFFIKVVPLISTIYEHICFLWKRKSYASPTPRSAAGDHGTQTVSWTKIPI